MKRIIFLLLGLLSICFIIATSIDKVDLKSKQFIWLEAEDAEKITWPIEVQNSEGASGNKCIVSLPGSHVNSVGYAQYDINIPIESEYVFWARCYWFNECADEFKLSVNGEGAINFGDHIMKQWHWVRGPSQILTGKTNLKILNYLTDAKLDKFLLTNDLNYKPIGDGSTQDYFIDFEDNQTNDFSFSQPDMWDFFEDTTGNKSLFIKQNDDEIIEYGTLSNLMSSNLIFKSLIQIVPDKKDSVDAIFIFDYVDQSNYSYIKYKNYNFSYYQLKEGQKEELRTVHIPDVFKYGIKNDITIYKNDSALKLKCNGKLVLKLKNINSEGGKIGIGSETGNIYFDDIITISNPTVYYRMNFHVVPELYEFRSENTRYYIENLKYAMVPWWKINGQWNRENYLKGVEPFLGRKENNREAFVVFGQDFWENYSLRMAMRTMDNNGMGVAFYLQDTLNYYLFKLYKSQDKLWNHQLIRVIDGRPTVLCSVKKEHQDKVWFRLDVNLQGDSIAIYKDKELIIKTIDTTFSDGKVGLFSNSTIGVYFDDIFVSPTNTAVINDNPANYTFAINEKISLDLSDWKYPKDKIMDARGGGVLFQKDLFEDMHLTYKEKLKGDFIINFDCWGLIQGIYKDYVLKCYSENESSKYHFQIANDHIFLRKDDEKILEKRILCHQELVTIKVVDNEWKLLEQDSLLISGCINNKIDSVQLSLGYSGIGKDDLYIGNIIIEQIRISD